VLGHPLRRRARGALLPRRERRAGGCGRSPEGGPVSLRLDATAEAALLEHDYPGNIRELENILRRAVILAQGPRIGLADLPPLVAARAGGRKTPSTNAELKAAKAAAAVAAARAVERTFITDLLAASGGNIAEAARRGVDPEAFRQPEN
jgi:DNA-binding NtrC family response regulator